jgi:hypothetical protein
MSDTSTLFDEAALVHTRHRANDHETSTQAASDVSFRAGTQKAKLLLAFATGFTLTDEQAAIEAGLSLRSCFWKRCGELREMGLIEFTGNTVMGSAGSSVGTSLVTPAGRRAAEALR